MQLICPSFGEEPKWLKLKGFQAIHTIAIVLYKNQRIDAQALAGSHTEDNGVLQTWA